MNVVSNLNIFDLINCSIDNNSFEYNSIEEFTVFCKYAYISETGVRYISKHELYQFLFLDYTNEDYKVDSSEQVVATIKRNNEIKHLLPTEYSHYVNNYGYSRALISINSATNVINIIIDYCEHQLKQNNITYMSELLVADLDVCHKLINVLNYNNIYKFNGRVVEDDSIADKYINPFINLI